MLSPNGARIIGTAETIAGTAGIRFTGNGTEFEWDGGTDVHWDAETRTFNGQTVFVDENGDEWLERELVTSDQQSSREIVDRILDVDQKRQREGRDPETLEERWASDTIALLFRRF